MWELRTEPISAAHNVSEGSEVFLSDAVFLKLAKVGYDLYSVPIFFQIYKDKLRA